MFAQLTRLKIDLENSEAAWTSLRQSPGKPRGRILAPFKRTSTKVPKLLTLNVNPFKFSKLAGHQHFASGALKRPDQLKHSLRKSKWGPPRHSPSRGSRSGECPMYRPEVCGDSYASGFPRRKPIFRNVPMHKIVRRSREGLESLACKIWRHGIAISVLCLGFTVVPVTAQMIDKNQASNNAKDGINLSYQQEIGAGRGDVTTPDSSLFIIARDPFRSIRRGRQIFQRKFTRAQGQGPLTGDGAGNIALDASIGAGLADSCAACHGRPRGSAGSGGDVATRPDSRDSPHLFGIGLREMLADEITADLRGIRDA